MTAFWGHDELAYAEMYVYADGMIWSLVFAASVPLLVGTAPSAPRSRNWQIMRYEYKEFCALTVVTWDLRKGKLTTAQGACDPQRTSPPTVTSKPIRSTDLAVLRSLSFRAVVLGIALTPCNSVPIHLLPGPSYFVVTKGGREVRSTNCSNATGRSLDEALTASLKP